MTTTTRLLSVAVRVADQDRAIAFYVDVLGCTLRTDVELWPGGRWVEVVPPGSPVAIVLLTEAGGMPVAPRFGTADAEAAHARLVAAGVDVGEVLRMEVAPPMLSLRDPDGNALVLIEDPPA
ncbi:VOC family protein [Microlunatus capsulatus]|uniref:Catechol 2,3-dioxygenase-like lactoylglutathione lyase family enzyme n=1 Tax=Microlunatus capsulatus TaxID=99117 RepID=A0ABS4Z3E6_9ACTN|nr:VOC family protein [Microlunatus capsulatus]MBP2415521.1 catechol 2,3-dioxygenase-like lactoylglutathione lyase family enzyme [Microlunatus capsulatus]